MDKKKTLLIRGIPQDIHKKFKRFCEVRGFSMTDVIIALMEEPLAEKTTVSFARTSRGKVYVDRDVIPAALIIPRNNRKERDKQQYGY